MTPHIPQTGSALSSRNEGALLPSVYDDGGCPLCRAEITSYQPTRGGEALRWVDASARDASALGLGLDRAAALAHMHARRADGPMLRVAAAFAEAAHRSAMRRTSA
jgi:hypothetical protein